MFVMYPSSSGARLVALRYRDFRLMWAGQLISAIGSQMQVIAINWHIYRLLEGTSASIRLLGRDLTLGGEALGLGGIGLARIIPIVLFALLGGMLADVRDRRRILIWAYSISGLLAALLAAITVKGWATVLSIYVLTAAGSAMFALEQPAQQSLVPNLVPAQHLTNAVSLNTLAWQIGTIVGPAVAGLLVAAFDLGPVYVVNGLSFFVVVGTLLAMRYRGRPAPHATGFGWRAVVEGWRFTRGTPIIWSTMMLDFAATLFGSARTMLPLVADQVLGIGVQGYGLLATAQPVGAVLTGAFLSLRRDIYRQGFILLISVALYGAATALFGLSTVFLVSYLLFALTGVGDTLSTVIRATIRQIKTPDGLRGRMTGINMIFFMGGPQLGELEAGLVAAAFGVPFAIFSGGLAVLALTAWIAWRYPRLRAYTSEA
jgi:MFS family permease